MKVKAFAEGSTDFKQYLNMQAKFHNYSFSNVVLILSQKPEATMVAGLGAANGYYSPDVKTIHVAAGLSPDQQAKTLAHEIGHHVLGHGPGHADSRSVAEVAAESVAYVTCAHFGLDTSSYTVGYVATWAGNDAKEIEHVVRSTLASVQRAAHSVIDQVQQHVQQEEKQALVVKALALKGRKLEPVAVMSR